MPITPYHLIIATPIKALLPRQFSWSVFCLTNIIIDLEPITFFIITLEPRHLFLHTIIGAIGVAYFSATIGRHWCEKALIIWNEEIKEGRWVVANTSIPFKSALMGAFTGGWSHLLLDSFMHDDIEPLSPFLNSNPLLGLINIIELHLLCVITGIIGIGLLLMRNKSTN